MVLDLNQLEPASELHADICIVGAGAAGMLAATELISKNVKVLLVESGDSFFIERVQKLYEPEVAGHTFNGGYRGRIRTIGGSTTRWAGQVLPLTPFDFQQREWVGNSGWPISFTDLERYYKRAIEYLSVDTLNYADDLFEKLNIDPPSFNKEALHYHFSKWTPNPNLKELFLPKIERAGNVTLMKNANLIKLDLAPSLKSATRFEFVSLCNRRVCSVYAKNFILCTGGIETARILLNNRHQISAGIGNEKDLVGRYFQDHPALTIGKLRARNASQIQKLFNFHCHQKRWYAVRFSLSETAQKKLRILNGSAEVGFENQSLANELYSIARMVIKEGLKGSRRSELLYFVRNMPKLLVPAYYLAFENRHVSPSSKFTIKVITEQEPNENSRIELSRDLDELGVPRAKINWKLTPLSWRTVSMFSEIIASEFKKANLGTVELIDQLSEEPGCWEDLFDDQNHHIGTTRMSNCVSSGVVNSDCRLHNVENVYIGSSAVFPTGGHSNPTLTILALTLRIIDKIAANRN